MATKKRTPEMTTMQLINRAIRDGASGIVISDFCNDLMDHAVSADVETGLVPAPIMDSVIALHTMAAKLRLLERENETLKRKLRRDNRRPSAKPAAELLKKTATPEPQPVQE